MPVTIQTKTLVMQAKTDPIQSKTTPKQAKSLALKFQINLWSENNLYFIKDNNSKFTNSILTIGFREILPWFWVVRREREPMKPQFLL